MGDPNAYIPIIHRVGEEEQHEDLARVLLAMQEVGGSDPLRLLGWSSQLVCYGCMQARVITTE